jgi:hypothetical protein
MSNLRQRTKQYEAIIDEISEQELPTTRDVNGKPISDRAGVSKTRLKFDRFLKWIKLNLGLLITFIATKCTGFLNAIKVATRKNKIVMLLLFAIGRIGIFLSFFLMIIMGALVVVKEAVKIRFIKIKDYVQSLNKIDTESSIMDGTTRLTYFQVIRRNFWILYRKHIKISITSTILLFIVLVIVLQILLGTQSVVITDKNGNVIENPFLFKIGDEYFLKNDEFRTFKSDSKWFTDFNGRELDPIDYSTGYFSAEVYKRGILNVTFNQTKELINERCGENHCICAALSQFGINKNIFLLKNDEATDYTLMYGFKVVDKSSTTLSSSITINGKKLNTKVPHSFIIEYFNENGKKIRYQTKEPVQSICIETLVRIQDTSFYI